MIELPAHLVETLRPDSVLVAHGYGQRSHLLSVARGRGVRDGDVIPATTIDEMVESGNSAAAAGIMDAVVAIEPVAETVN